METKEMQKRKFLRHLLMCTVVPCATVVSSASWAAAPQDDGFPNKPITLILPYAPGGPTDQHLRVVAQEASKILGQPIVLENRPGSNGVTAAAALTRAAPDGYTLGVLPASVYREPHINKVPFDPISSFSYVAMLSDYSFGLAVKQDAPWKSWEELVADAKKRPGQLNIGATGAAGTPRVVMEEAMAIAGVKMNVIPYKGDGDVATAILGGHVDAAPLSGVAVPHIEAGKMRYLVMLTSKRIPRFPELPTLQDAGVKAFIDSPYGIAGPKGMRSEHVQRLAQAFKQALLSPEGLKVLAQLNQQPNYMAPDEYFAYAKESYAREKKRVTWLRQQGLLE